jgi:hypothetical protein
LGDLSISEAIARSGYDALTLRFAVNIGKSTSINAGYAHGRNFVNGTNGNANNLDQTNINQYYGPTQQDIARIFNAQLRAELPVGSGKRFLGIPIAWWALPSAAGNIRPLSISAAEPGLM